MNILLDYIFYAKTCISNINIFLRFQKVNSKSEFHNIEKVINKLKKFPSLTFVIKLYTFNVQLKIIYIYLKKFQYLCVIYVWKICFTNSGANNINFLVFNCCIVLLSAVLTRYYPKIELFSLKNYLNMSRLKLEIRMVYNEFIVIVFLIILE